MAIPYDTDHGLRNSVLLRLAQDVVTAGGTVTGISQTAGETQPNWLLFLNRISVAVNALGATPALPIYLSLDYSAFQSVVNNVVAALTALGTPPLEEEDDDLGTQQLPAGRGGNIIAGGGGPLPGKPS